MSEFWRTISVAIVFYLVIWIWMWIRGEIDPITELKIFFSEWKPPKKKTWIAILICLGIVAVICFSNEASNKKESSTHASALSGVQTNNNGNKNNNNSGGDELMIDLSGKVVYITRTGEKYHRNGCQYLRSSKIEISLGDAIRLGYDPCSVCDP